MYVCKFSNTKDKSCKCSSKNYSILRYIVFVIFVLLHLTFISIVMLGAFFTPYVLILHFIVQIQWIVLNYECIGSIIERKLHPNGLTLFGRITWHSFALLWFDFIIFSIYWIILYYKNK